MIIAKHVTLPDRKRFSGIDDLCAFMKKEPNPELWAVDLDAFKCTGDEVVKARSGYQTKTLTPRSTAESKKSMITRLLKHRKKLLQLLTK